MAQTTIINVNVFILYFVITLASL